MSTALRIVLQMPLGGTLEQPGQWAPREFRAVFLRQVLLDQQPDVGERRELDDVGMMIGRGKAATNSGQAS